MHSVTVLRWSISDRSITMPTRTQLWIAAFSLSAQHPVSLCLHLTKKLTAECIYLVQSKAVWEIMID